MTTINAWVATAAKQPLVRQSIDLGPLGAEEVEVQVENCGLCHSDLSVLQQRLGHVALPRPSSGTKSIGRVVAVGPSAKGLKVGQRVGIGWTAGSCMHCRPCKSGDHHLCPRRSRRSSAIAAGSRVACARIGLGRFRCPRTLNVRRCRAAASAAASRSSIRWRCTPSRRAASASSASAASGTWA